MKPPQKNQFFDINKLPAQPGLIVFPISMSAINTKQSAQQCFTHMEHFSHAGGGKVQKRHVGLTFIYTDFLYFHSDESAARLRNKFLQGMVSHKNEFMKLVKKNPWYIDHAFSFTTWSTVLIQANDFAQHLAMLKRHAKEDSRFRETIEDDARRIGRKLDENQLNFFLEEALFMYLVSKGSIRLPNEFVNGKEQWVLVCYPGPPLKTEIYIYQKNIFKLKNPGNEYENCYYDLDKKLLYNYSRVDLKTIQLSNA